VLLGAKLVLEKVVLGQDCPHTCAEVSNKNNVKRIEDALFIIVFSLRLQNRFVKTLA
jgi:hypothetical protein